MIISRYLTKEVLTTLMGITSILVLAFLSQQIVRYLNYVAVGKIPTNVLIELVSFEIPYLLSFLLPLGLYLGIILTYGRLSANNEMAILKLSGFNLAKLYKVTFQLALLIFAIVLILMLWINPWISAKREQVMASDEATLHLIQTLIPGRFQVSPDGKHVMYVEKLTRDHKVAKNVFLAQQSKKKVEDNQQVWTLVHADQGYEMVNENKEQFFVTTDGYRYEGKPGESDYKIINYKKYTVRLPQSSRQLSHQETEMQSSWDLLKSYQNPKSAAELQWRVSAALSALVLAFLAIPMSGVRPRGGKYMVLIPAIIIYVLYFNLLFISRHYIEQTTIPIIIGMWWVHFLAIGLALFFILFIKRSL